MPTPICSSRYIINRKESRKSSLYLKKAGLAGRNIVLKLTKKKPTLYLTLPKKISFNRFNEDLGEYRVVLVSDYFPV